MWWECRQCPAGGNNPIAMEKHTLNTGHIATVTYDARTEEG